MTTFEYKGYDASGHAQGGLIEAADLKDARKRLAARGILPELLQAVGGSAARRAAKAAAFPADIRTMFYRELAALLGSGVALVPALDVILQAPELDQARALLAAVRDRVREGRALSAAMAAVSAQVTPFEQAVMEVGERTGGMNEALDRLAAFLEEQEKLREKLMTALLYPVRRGVAGGGDRRARAGVHAADGPAAVRRNPHEAAAADADHADGRPRARGCSCCCWRRAPWRAPPGSAAACGPTRRCASAWTGNGLPCRWWAAAGAI